MSGETYKTIEELLAASGNSQFLFNFKAAKLHDGVVQLLDAIKSDVWTKVFGGNAGAVLDFKSALIEKGFSSWVAADLNSWHVASVPTVNLQDGLNVFSIVSSAETSANPSADESISEPLSYEMWSSNSGNSQMSTNSVSESQESLTSVDTKTIRYTYFTSDQKLPCPEDVSDLVSEYLEHLAATQPEVYCLPQVEVANERHITVIVKSLFDYFVQHWDYLPVHYLKMFLIALSNRKAMFTTELNLELKRRLLIKYRNYRKYEKKKQLKGKRCSLNCEVRVKAKKPHDFQSFEQWVVNKTYAKCDRIFHYIFANNDFTEEIKFLSEIENWFKKNKGPEMNKLVKSSETHSFYEQFATPMTKALLVSGYYLLNKKPLQPNWDEPEEDKEVDFYSTLRALEKELNALILTTVADTNGLIAGMMPNCYKVRLGNTFILKKEFPIERAFVYFFMATYYFDVTYSKTFRGLMVFVERVVFDWNESNTAVGVRAIIDEHKLVLKTLSNEYTF